ncbi:MAG: lysophospholipid acyltransferase family protein [Polyangiaceae bacterium]|nr:lysophospholipid acyltransferase family protein [Polyangiaceae bacterium]
MVTLRGWFGRTLQLLRILLCGLAFVGFGVGGVLLAWCVLPLVALWPGGAFERRQLCQRLVRGAWIVFHDYMRLTGLVAFNHRQVELHVEHPSVIIANHPTLVDITALGSALGAVCFVAKRPLFKNPVFGPLLRVCGHICGAERDVAEADGAFAQALLRLSEGHSVLLFPEGTRSPVHGLRRFRIGAFELARRARVPLVVIGISAEPRALSKGTPWYRIPKVAMRLQLWPLLTFDNWDAVPGLESLSELRTRVRELLWERTVMPVKAGSNEPGPGSGAANFQHTEAILDIEKAIP